MYTERLARAVEIASIAHDRQYRKDPRKRVPYVSHPLIVGMMLAQHGYSENTVIAGILHDTVEDTRLSLNDILQEFGSEVARLVETVSEPNKKTPWHARKQHYRRCIEAAGEAATAISCCDKLHNMKSLLESAKVTSLVWRRFKGRPADQLRIFEELLPVYAKSLPQGIINQYTETLRSLADVVRRGHD